MVLGGQGSFILDDLLGRSASDQGLAPGQVENLPPDIVDLASGQSYSYAFTSDGLL